MKKILAFSGKSEKPDREAELFGELFLFEDYVFSDFWIVLFDFQFALL